jgi:RNA polymerase sigma-70 factor (ECF subfamily)
VPSEESADAARDDAEPVAAAGPGAELVERARRGDHGAFAEAVACYDDRLRALAFRLLGDRDGMDDAMQEAYVKAFRALPTFKGDACLGTWLYRITYNVCIDELRRRPSTLVVTSNGSEPAAAGPDPADAAVTRGDLATALAALPPDHRAAVLLVDAHGFDYAEAGRILGIPSGTVASRLSRARQALRRALVTEP